MKKIIQVSDVINSKKANNTIKGELLFDKITKICKNSQDIIILDFNNIELVNLSFLNRVIGRLIDVKTFDRFKHDVKIINMKPSMTDLLRESICFVLQK